MILRVLPGIDLALFYKVEVEFLPCLDDERYAVRIRSIEEKLNHEDVFTGTSHQGDSNTFGVVSLAARHMAQLEVWRSPVD